ncbi:hypothetical protein MVEN_00257200 [Mycena venus]|uniref:Uncharacterized protein n=1 Tax=Mycena venus TaxID=2733690 RepID=A0A8H7DBF2_9AGAR|nr:hypothetical protein MVEN_00257200 [Mycena venus]
MRFPFLSRARLKTLRVMRKPKSKPSSSSQMAAHHTLSDILWTSLLALKESADAFPPLQSAVGGVIALCDIAERAKHSKADACAIAIRTKEIIDVVADAVPDGSVISPPMLRSIERFTVLLEEIGSSMEVIALTGGVSRIVHLNRNERALKAMKTRLEDTYWDFLAASALRLEVGQTQLAIQQEKFGVQQDQIHLDLKTVSETTSNVALELRQLLFQARVAVLFGRPLIRPLFNLLTSP